MVKLRVTPIIPKGAKVNTRVLAVKMRDVVRDTAADGQRFVAKYPSQTNTASGYRRTNTLKRSWGFKVKVQRNRIVGEVLSNSGIAPYNRWVQGQQQTTLHRRGRWRNVRALSSRMDKDFRERAQKAVDAALRV